MMTHSGDTLIQEFVNLYLLKTQKCFIQYLWMCLQWQHKNFTRNV